MSEQVTDDIRREVFRKFRGRCAICGTTKNLQVHHVTYRSHGGNDAVSNFVLLCWEHHITGEHEGELTIEDYDPENMELVVSDYDGDIWINENNENQLSKAHSLHGRLSRFIDVVQASFWEIGGLLLEINEHNAWEKLGYETFQDYVEDPEIDINYHSAKKLMRIRRRMEKALENNTITEQQILDMKMEKADRISKFVGNENFEEWVHKALTMSQSELKKEIREERKGKPKKLTESNLGKPKYEKQTVDNNEPVQMEASNTPERSRLAVQIQNMTNEYDTKGEEENLIEAIFKTVEKYRNQSGG